MGDDTDLKPYPLWLESPERLRDGTEIHLRPLKAEDESLLQDLAAHMTPEDLRLRFFAAVHGLSHAVAERLAHVDYDRAMALLAEENGIALGVARFHAEPDRRAAEYAIAVRSDWKGRGLGYLLMTRLIAVAREWGVGELVGEVLPENRRMLQMCRELGFTIAADPADPSLIQVRKPLRESEPPRAASSGANQPMRCWKNRHHTAEDPMTVATQPAKSSEIVAIVGHLDDGVIARILATGATPAEVLEAFTWAHADDQLGRELLRRPHGAAGAVFDILMREEPDPDELR